MIWVFVIGSLIGIGTMMLMPERDIVEANIAVVVGIAGSTVPAVLGHALGWHRYGERAEIISSVVIAILLSSVYLALLVRALHETDQPAKQAGH